MKEPLDAANRNRQADRAHLIALLDRHGAAHPGPGATHLAADLGRHALKWESHTEFVTYSSFVRGVPERPFDPHAAEVFPAAWLAAAHAQLDAAVAAAYGWADYTADMPDDEILRRLLALNLQRTAPAGG